MSSLFNYCHVQQPFLMDEALLSISPAGRDQLVKILITRYCPLQIWAIWIKYYILF